MNTDGTEDKANEYVSFVNLLIEAGDTILIFALPIWLGFAIGDSVLEGIFVGVGFLVLFHVPFLPFPPLFKMFWHIVGFILLIPLNLKRLFSDD